MKHALHPNPVTDRLAALGEMVRLRLLRLVEAEELSVGEIASVVQLPQSTVSRHLKVLAEGGWLARRTEGPAALYRLVLDDLEPEARDLWLTVREQLGEASDLAEDDRRLVSILGERRRGAFFGQVAGRWDQIREHLFGRSFTASALLSLLPEDWVVADVGCGTGNATELLAPAVRQVIAVDESETMLDAARERFEGCDNVRLVQGELEELPLDDASVDAVICLLVLHYLGEPALAVAEMRRVLRTDHGGGIALIVDMYPHDRIDYKHTMGHKHLGFDEGVMAQMLADAGFEPTIKPLPSDPGGKGPGLFVATGRIK